MVKNLKLGDLSITGLKDINRFSIPVKNLFPDFDDSILRKNDPLPESVMSKGLIHLTIRSWLLRQSGKNILIDSCVGADKERPNHPAWHKRNGMKWLNALKQKGLKPEDIDIVLCTHLHADHVGWNTKLENGIWVPTFPNAKYVCGKIEYNYWNNTYKETDKHGAFEDSILPIVKKNQMEFVEDGWDLIKGLKVQVRPGHTIGHLCLESDRGALFCGDVLHSPLQLRHPELSSAFCSDPDLARSTREKLLMEISESAGYLIPAHFADPGWTKIKKFGTGYREIT